MFLHKTKLRIPNTQFLVTPKQYKFFANYCEEFCVYPLTRERIIFKEFLEEGFEFIFKGLGISPERRKGFKIIDLRKLGNNLSKWIYKFNSTLTNQN